MGWQVFAPFDVVWLPWRRFCPWLPQVCCGFLVVIALSVVRYPYQVDGKDVMDPSAVPDAQK